jgi:integrase
MGRQSRGTKPQSGIPGLLWRQRDNSGSWVVSLNVPTELRGRIVSSTGKPLTRLERSTKTDSLAIAKKRYAKVMAALRGELEAKAGRNIETGVDRARRAIASAYVQQTSDHYLDAINKIKTELSQSYPAANNFIDELMDDWLYVVNSLFLNADQRLTGKEKEGARAALSFAIKSAKETNYARKEQGLFAEASQVDKKLRKAAKASNQLSFDDVLKHKRDELSERTFGNLEITISHWKKIIGSTRLDSISTVNLNRFARELKRPKESDGRGFTTNAANDSAVRIRSLIRTHNVNLADESGRIDWPKFDPIQHTTAEKKAQKLKVRAITAEDAKKILNYSKDADEHAWRALLILSNSTFRASEVCALRWGDIKDTDGVIYFDLTDSKTVEGLRRLPLNSRLRKHLLPLRGADDEFIINNSWPKWSRPRDGLGHFLAVARRVLNIDGRTNAHSFRHAAGGDLGYHLPEHTKKKLMGHAGGMTDHYTREDMNVLNKAVEFIGFDF